VASFWKARFRAGRSPGSLFAITSFTAVFTAGSTALHTDFTDAPTAVGAVGAFGALDAFGAAARVVVLTGSASVVVGPAVSSGAEETSAEGRTKVPPEDELQALVAAAMATRPLTTTARRRNLEEFMTRDAIRGQPGRTPGRHPG
jgi:hypothetical protein